MPSAPERDGRAAALERRAHLVEDQQVARAAHALDVGRVALDQQRVAHDQRHATEARAVPLALVEDAEHVEPGRRRKVEALERRASHVRASGDHRFDQHDVATGERGGRQVRRDQVQLLARAQDRLGVALEQQRVAGVDQVVAAGREHALGVGAHDPEHAQAVVLVEARLDQALTDQRAVLAHAQRRRSAGSGRTARSQTRQTRAPATWRSRSSSGRGR